jgi:hypothetical protein
VGKITGFMEFQRQDESYLAPEARLKNYKELGLPGQQHHPGLERPGLPRPLPRSAEHAALDQQLPGIHRPHLPGALRGRLHPGHQQ